MTASEEIRVFLAMAEASLHDPIATHAQHIRWLPEPLQSQLATALEAISHDRYEPGEMAMAAQLVASLRQFPGGLDEAIQAIIRTLIDNDAFRY
ncbi:MAG TPA: hypothetical protein VG456_24230 [Candidatus Sulfopaludibacter sp.]|jgi:hypothetical protein|nr:hypothetical protein [Candidatus Sulfopaludibacter sp.]